MTEDEAKSRWCPMARPANSNANRNASDGSPRAAAHCLASGCAMWRWNSTTTGYCGLAGAPTGSWAGGGA